MLDFNKINSWQAAAVLLCVSGDPLVATAAGTPAATVLWYQQPAVKWEEAMPVGNGRLGAMVFGGTAEERLQLTRERVDQAMAAACAKTFAQMRQQQLRIPREWQQFIRNKTGK